MALDSVCIGNFKGISATQTLQIRPITLFIGPNSSGKSSAIHALAALAQTVNLPNNTRPLVLDDQYAYVHLGRFIEIIHSRKYSDTITLGLSGGHTRAHAVVRSGLRRMEGKPSAQYIFGSTRRTQDVFLKSAIIRIEDRCYRLRQQESDGFKITRQGSARSFRVELGAGFSINPASIRGRASYMELQPLFAAQRTLGQELVKTLYLGPFREPPQRRYPTRGSAPREVGPRGEATVTLLANEMVQSKSRKHTKQVSGWFNMLGLATHLAVARVGSSDLFDVNITLVDGSTFPLADLGYGFSQIMPVLTQLSFAPDGGTVLFEQPELHLHSLAVRPLASVFIDAVRKKNLHIIAETHSPELFGQFLVEMRNNNLDPASFIAYRVIRENGFSKITPIEIDVDTFDVYELWQKELSRP